MNKKLNYQLAILTVKALTKIIKLCNFGAGTNFPGRIGRRIAPDILSYLVNQSKKEIIVITGTNGKTTTTGLIASILDKAGLKAAHNKRGANMLSGLTAAIIQQSNLNAQLNVDHCLMEIDEAYFLKAVDEFNPDLLLVTNLFRDQLDRYGELDTTAKKIKEAISKTINKKPLKVILNCDDPIVSAITDNLQVQNVFFGFKEILFAEENKIIKTPQEAASCKCGGKFDYSKIFYGHLGHYNCSCGYKRPTPDIEGSAIIGVTGSKIDITSEKYGKFSINLNMPGLYNAYNALAAAVICLENGIDSKSIINGLENYSTVFGRAEQTTLKGKPVLIQLIKNPIGATEVLRTVKDDNNSKLLIIINDNYADGRDVSWLWDANFELLAEHRKEIITSGIRAFDMATRLKYAGIAHNNIKVIGNIDSALSYSLSKLKPDEKLYVLPTYTALLDMQKILKKYPG
jgi:UDP-N-acetylmuramyl tripeptide synthase